MITCLVEYRYISLQRLHLTFKTSHSTINKTLKKIGTSEDIEESTCHMDNSTQPHGTYVHAKGGGRKGRHGHQGDHHVVDLFRVSTIGT